MLISFLNVCPYMRILFTWDAIGIFLYTCAWSFKTIEFPATFLENSLGMGLEKLNYSQLYKYSYGCKD